MERKYILRTDNIALTVNKKIMEKNYEAPQVEVIKIEVEKGFSMSIGGETDEWD